MTDESTVYLFDLQNKFLVEAIIRDAIDKQQLTDWEFRWKPEADNALERLTTEGGRWPENSHWEWPAKMARTEGLLADRSFSIVCSGVTQGMMQVDLTKNARLPEQKGKPLVYIKYVETAPWNRPALVAAPKFAGVGTLFIRAAVQLSEEEGYQGRIGLHALPQANSFYQQKLKMIDLGPDPDEYNLNYFEMTPTLASTFAGGV
jgi:hypothetical protein